MRNYIARWKTRHMRKIDTGAELLCAAVFALGILFGALIDYLTN